MSDEQSSDSHHCWNWFSDPEGPNLVSHVFSQMVAANVTFRPEPTGPLAVEGHLNDTVSWNSFFMLIPLESHHKICLPPCITSDSSLNRAPVKIDQLVWSTRFRTNSAIANHTFTRLGAVISLVGDAAHVHSPAGGQGAIRDAVFLAETVTKHIQPSA
ncbi:hypothetical protein BDR07DRAFT_1478033 [Suillus spraguei]|nr:hypothetical protein BDR07DRAFT_1478033 [Suillus spraguei]